MSPSTSSGLNKLVIIDGNAIMHRAFHALPPLTNKKGEPIGAVYGFTSMLLRIIDDLKPTHLAVCFDRKEPTFRKKAYKKYQAHRPETDKNLATQFAVVKKAVKSFDIPVYEKAGYEADDLIGTIAERAVRLQTTNYRVGKRKKAVDISRKAVDQVIIVTGDKDILQLVNKKVKVYLPVRGLSKAKMMGVNEVVEKLGVKPDQIVDYKALVGDPSDNYPGVYGIGPKTAENLLREYQSFEAVYKNIKLIDESIKKKLIEGKKEGLLSKKLAKIVTDVDFKFDLNKMDKWAVGRKETVKLFEEIGFKTLKKRIQGEVVKTINKAPSQNKLKAVSTMLARFFKGKRYAIRGTMSLVLQGYEMGVDDIDVLTDKKTALLCNSLLKKHLYEKVEYKQSEQYKSYFGKFVINKILVEVYGNWQIRVKGKRVKGKWSKIFNASKEETKTIKVGGLEVNVTKPEVELAIFASEGRWNAYHKLKKQIDSKNQQSLF